MPLPSRTALQVRRTATEMLTLVRLHLQQDQPGAISDMDYFRRSDRVIKTLVEEYEPLAQYLYSIDSSATLAGCLTSPGAPADAEIWDGDRLRESIQIVHGTSNYSEALKRESLCCGEIVFANSEYRRSEASRTPVEGPSQMSPGGLAEDTAASIIQEIEKKVAKKYSGIDTLIVVYDETMSTTVTNSNQVITNSIDAWIGTKTSLDVAPFTKIVIVSNNGHTRSWKI